MDVDAGRPEIDGLAGGLDLAARAAGALSLDGPGQVQRPAFGHQPDLAVASLHARRAHHSGGVAGQGVDVAAFGSQLSIGAGDQS